MGLPFPGLGVVFDINDLGGGYYGPRAWQIFMRHATPTLLGSTILLEGDTSLTLDGRRNEFCIGAYGLMLNVDILREKFERATDIGLAPLPRRIMEKTALDTQPLVNRGRIDAAGRFITAAWTRTDHDLCKEAQWPYAPEAVPQDLAVELKRELEAMWVVRFDSAPRGLPSARPGLPNKRRHPIWRWLGRGVK